MRTEQIRRLATAALRILALTAAYYGSARIGLLEQVEVAGVVVTPLWPPTGIAVSCLLLFGLSVWPGIALGTLFTMFSIGPPSITLTSLGIILGNTLAPICAYLMLRRVGFRTALDRLRDGVALVVLGAFAGMLVSATVASASLLVTGELPANGFWPTWVAWWAGDAMGVLIVAPLLLALRRARLPRDIGLARWAEATALVLASVGVAALATRASIAVLFLVFPLIVWAALRFQLGGAAPCTLLVSVLAVTAATDRAGPFSRHGIVEVMVNLQALNGSTALTALLLSAIITEQNAIRRKIERACAELADVVDRLAPGEAGLRWPPAAGGRDGGDGRIGRDGRVGPDTGSGGGNGPDGPDGLGGSAPPDTPTPPGGPDR